MILWIYQKWEQERMKFDSEKMKEGINRIANIVEWVWEKCLKVVPRIKRENKYSYSLH